jgi:hypothetical protein
VTLAEVRLEGEEWQRFCPVSRLSLSMPRSEFFDLFPRPVQAAMAVAAQPTVEQGVSDAVSLSAAGGRSQKRDLPEMQITLLGQEAAKAEAQGVDGGAIVRRRAGRVAE